VQAQNEMPITDNGSTKTASQKPRTTHLQPMTAVFVRPSGLQGGGMAAFAELAWTIWQQPTNDNR